MSKKKKAKAKLTNKQNAFNEMRDFLQFRSCTLFSIIPSIGEDRFHVYVRISDTYRIDDVRKIGRRHGCKVNYTNLTSFAEYCRHFNRKNLVDTGLMLPANSVEVVDRAGSFIEAKLVEEGDSLFRNVGFHEFDVGKQEFREDYTMDFILQAGDMFALFAVEKRERGGWNPQGRVKKVHGFTQRVYKRSPKSFRVVQKGNNMNFYEFAAGKEKYRSLVEIKRMLD
jgi:hypothetical protein